MNLWLSNLIKVFIQTKAVEKNYELLKTFSAWQTASSWWKRSDNKKGVSILSSLWFVSFPLGSYLIFQLLKIYEILW